MKGQRAKAKVKSKVLQKQEEKVKQLELRNSQLEREARKFRDRSALLQVEKDGLEQRLAVATSKLRRNAIVLASDQQVIAFLNWRPGSPFAIRSISISFNEQ